MTRHRLDYHLSVKLNNMSTKTIDSNAMIAITEKSIVRRKLTRAYITEKMAIVQYLPKYASARKAPNNGVT